MDMPQIAYEKFQLKNGLTVIVHEDHKAPVVAVSVWYHVGSANEPVGKTGFAHLFEHLMFSGSEHHKDVFFKPFELVGATDQNGTTSLDRTNYFQTVPTTALDMALWMESDRMGHLLGAIGQQELDTQRGVVKNEKRENENEPYGRAWEELQRQTFPANHPYAHTTIGSMEDIDAATLDDVQDWFRTYYGCANVVLVLAGDITPAEAREKVEIYFCDIHSGPQVTRPAPWVAPRVTSTRSEQIDNVPMVRIMREWNVAPLGDADTPLLQLAAHMLGSGPTSRLVQRLVHRDKLAASVSVGLHELALASMFLLSVDVRPGVDPRAVEAAIAEEWEAFLRYGPDKDELSRVSTSLRAEFVRGLEKVGGFGGKASVLAQGELYRGNPAAYKSDLEQWHSATPVAVAAAARRWIALGDYTLVIRPADGEEAVAATAPSEGLPASAQQPAAVTSPVRRYMTKWSPVDRSLGVPSVDRFPELSFPKVHRAALSNGMQVVLAERHTIPVTQVLVQFDAGLAAEQGRNSGVARMATAMLSEGTRNLDSVGIARMQQRLGAQIRPLISLDSSMVLLSTVNTGLASSLELLSDMVRNPAYRETDLDRLRTQTLAQVRRELSSPEALSSRLLPRLTYGAGHAYGVPHSGTGSISALHAITPADLSDFHRTWLRPDCATLFVAGDTTLEAILPMLEATFGDWTSTIVAREKTVSSDTKGPSARVHLIHRPGEQTLIVAGRPVAPAGGPQYQAMRMANAILGGMFSSRLNMNIREDKRWAYGAHSGVQDSVGPRHMSISAAVQADKTVESIQEILGELQGFVGDRPPTVEELDKVKAQTIRALPGAYESTDAVLGTLLANHLYDRADDYAQNLKHDIETTDLSQVIAAGREMFAPAGLTWIVVGDLTQIEAPVRALGLGEVEVVAVDSIG